MHGNHAQGATGDNGAFFTEHQNHDTANGYFPAFDDNQSPSNAYATGFAPVPSDPWAGARFATVESNANQSTGWENWQGTGAEAYHSYHDEVCPTCGFGSYFQDECSTDTSTDNESYDGSVAESLDASEVCQDYAFARGKWRRFSGRYPRRYRKWGKGKSKGSKGFAAFLPSSAFAGGKGGFQKGHKGSGHRKNPKDRNGQVMRCNNCGSDEHLWRKCPNRRSDAGKGGSAIPTGVSMAHMSQPAGQQLALMTSHPGLWGVSQSNTAGVLPGVHFSGTEFENLRSVSEAASGRPMVGREFHQSQMLNPMILLRRLAPAQHHHLQHGVPEDRHHNPHVQELLPM